MKNFVHAIWNSWDRFFFGPISFLPVGVFRFVFGLNLLIMYSLRIKDWRFFFTDEGFISAENAMKIVPEFYEPLFTWYPTTPALSLGLHVVFLVTILLLMLGLWGRWMACLTLILHLAFMQRNFSIIYGADLVSTFFLFGLAFTENDRRFSLRSYFAKGQPREIKPVSHIFSTVGVRLIQIQLCVIYGFTGLEKLKGNSWWEGTAVWAVLGNQQIMLFDTSWLKSVPLLIAAMTYSTLIFEIYFPVLVWLKVAKRWTLLFGALLHTMIAVTVGLFFFSLAMISTYLIFLDPAWLRAKLSRFVPDAFIGNEASSR